LPILACCQLSSLLAGPGERAAGSVDQMGHDRVCGSAGGDRWDCVLPSHASAGGTAWAARLGRGADSAVGGWDDRGRLDHSAGRLTRGTAWRGAAVGACCDRQRGEPGRQCRGSSAGGGRSGDRSLAVICAYLRLRVAHAAGSVQCRGWRQAVPAQARATGPAAAGGWGGGAAPAAPLFRIRSWAWPLWPGCRGPGPSAAGVALGVSPPR